GPTYALALAVFNMRLRTEQGVEETHGALSLLFKRTAEGWKIIHSHASTQGLPEPDVSELPEPGPLEGVYIASMKSDLRNLVTAEEAFFADSVRYTNKVGRGGLSFEVSRGNTIPTIKVTSDGWTAIIGNVNTTTRCVMFVGSTAIPPATREGEPRCF
ncbi:MAG: nuclear transport factor 2 family protein, partial [bacterium]